LFTAFSKTGSDDRQRALENRKRTALRVEELDKDVLRLAKVFFCLFFIITGMV
jgi:hypothetical protein